MYVSFEEWTKSRQLASLGTNAGSEPLPFQGWRKFKEAFAPELVSRAIGESPRPVRRILDPFGGCGTTALAGQFLGAHPTIIEVNPYLSDLIEAKISSYDFDLIQNSYCEVVEVAAGRWEDPRELYASAPASFTEPGINGRYIFSLPVLGRITAYRSAVDALPHAAPRRLLRVLLATAAVSVSNVVISGKGRRYRRRWADRMPDPDAFDQAFRQAVLTAIFDLRRYEARRCRTYTLKRGDARQLIQDIDTTDLAVFSPPYPNSFDYTDVYNIELWLLGYLNGKAANRALRESTIRSHVQIKRDMSADPSLSPLLKEVQSALEYHRDKLWNPHIPAMIGAYFSDMRAIMRTLYEKLCKGGRAYMVVGDSRYAGVDVPVASILSQEISSIGFDLIAAEPFRSMRASPQQGGRAELSESLIVCARP